MEPYSHLTRRNLLMLAGAGLAGLPLDAAATDFWNKKPPSQWTHEEIDRLITKSPWAKDVKANYAPGESSATGNPNPNGGNYPGGQGGGYPGGGQGRSRGGIGIPGIGGLSIPGIGGGGGRPRNGGGSQRTGGVSPYEGTVRWESALPIQDAMKSALPDAFDGHYVICVTGIPLMGGARYQGEDDDSASSRRQDQDDLDRLKGLSSLQVKGKDLIQAGVAQRQVSSASNFLLGFSKEILPLNEHDTEVVFSTQLGRLVVKAHFLLKEMLYHGELAV